MRVIRENAGRAAAPSTGSARRPRSCSTGWLHHWHEIWHEDRAAARDLVEQIMALDESAARCPPGSDLDRA